LSENDLNHLIGKGVSLIDFNAPWCAPCHVQEPILTRIAGRFQGKAAVGVINVDTLRKTAQDMGIRSIPTLILFKNGKEIQRFVGLQSETVLSQAIENLLAG
jgi:thioredoxin 1